MHSRDKQVYTITGILLALLPLALILPRWLTPADAGFGAGAVAASIFMFSLAGLSVVALILFLFSWFKRDELSKTARIVGLTPFPVIGSGFILLFINLVF
jgi:hypothetical protein